MLQPRTIPSLGSHKKGKHLIKSQTTFDPHLLLPINKNTTKIQVKKEEARFSITLTLDGEFYL